jgi:lysine decarboxylase
MDQHEAPSLTPLRIITAGAGSFLADGHRRGRGVDPAVLKVLGRGPFRDDVLAGGV